MARLLQPLPFFIDRWPCDGGVRGGRRSHISLVETLSGVMEMDATFLGSFPNPASMAGPLPGVSVRAARREDIPGIIAVAETSVTEAETEGFGAPSEESPFRDAARLSAAWVDPNRVGSELIYVAEVDSVVVGVVTVEGRGSELELVDIDVPRRLQGQGIGRSLVAFVEDLARSDGCNAVTLGTSRNADGVPWRSFGWWLSIGYRVTHEEENEWTRSIGPGAREIRMSKGLSR